MQRNTNLTLEHLVRPPSRGPEGEGAKVPGLLLLHGRGADEMDLMGLADAIDPRLMIVSARGLYRLGFGYAWYEMPRIGSPDPVTIRESIVKLDKFIPEIIEAYDINPQRLFLMGFSQGGILSSALTLMLAGRFRGVVMHSSYVPTTAGLPIQPENVRGLPFFVAHGKYDGTIPLALGRAGAEYLREAGADLTYYEYPIGHQISEESLYDLSEWLTNEVDASEGNS
jgi:phospholipase/carboxylesterase